MPIIEAMSDGINQDVSRVRRDREGGGESVPLLWQARFDGAQQVKSCAQPQDKLFRARAIHAARDDLRRRAAWRVRVAVGCCARPGRRSAEREVNLVTLAAHRGLLRAAAWLLDWSFARAITPVAHAEVQRYGRAIRASTSTCVPKASD